MDIIGEKPIKTKYFHRHQKLTQIGPIYQTWTHTLVLVNQFLHIFTLENFNNCGTRDSNNKEKLTFPKFTSPNNDCEFYLKLYPKGKEDKFRDYVSMYLYSPQEGISAICSLSLVDNCGRSTYSHSK